jgi:peptidoglycan/LPS O-acetylase OafA/YrhL
MRLALTPGQSFVCDAIRYVAALAVAVHHLPSLLKPDAYLAADRPIANLGEIGVTAFFILSGLLISHTVSRKAQSSGYTFRE